MNEHDQRSNGSQIRRGCPRLFIERRRATRFDLQLPVTFRWRDESELREAHTRCENLSTKGIKFFLAEDINDGTNVVVEVTLPTQITLDKLLRVVCSGHVQRKNLEGAKLGVAVVIESYRLLYDSLPAPASFLGDRQIGIRVGWTGLTRAVSSEDPYASGDKEKQVEAVSVERAGPIAIPSSEYSSS